MSELLSWLGLRDRPPGSYITPDQTHWARKGLVFGGLALGGCERSKKYQDSSLYSNHGTLTNMDPATDWVWDSALGRWMNVFRGANDKYILVNPLKWTTQPYTLAGWVQWTSTAETYTFLFGSGVTLRINQDGTLHATLVTSMSWPLATSNEALNDGAYAHVAAVYRTPGSHPLLYINGMECTYSTTNNGSGTISSVTQLGIGATTANPWANKFSGNVGDVLLLARNASPSEIQQLADPSNVMLSGLILPPARRLWPVAVSGDTTNKKLAHHGGMMAM